VDLQRCRFQRGNAANGGYAPVSNDLGDEPPAEPLGAGVVRAGGEVENCAVEDFIRLHSAARERLFSFAMAISPNWHDAEEIIQEASLVLYRKFDSFDRSTDFFAWACQVIRYEVYNHRRRDSRRRVLFSNDFVERLADVATQQAAGFDERCEALQQCLQKLASADQRLIELYYQKEATTAAVAKEVNRPLDSVYKSLQRIRKALLVCIERRLTAGV
jgi:RNA polymerase sigma-70 factor (ECF subfamily)